MKDKILALLRPQASPDVKLSVISLFLAKCLEMYESRIVDLEARQLQKGDKGDKGDSIIGPQGPRGERGPAGKDAPKAKDGRDGKDGADGKDGVSVVDADIDIDDHLVFKLSNGKEVDAGELPVRKALASISVAGNAYQITVSATAPSNPQVNDLWLDIS